MNTLRILALLLLASTAANVARAQTVMVMCNPPENRCALQKSEKANFGKARKLLLAAKVPFEPDMLLDPNWPTRLAGVLDKIPQMHERRREKSPLRGVYFADVIYLPELVSVKGATVVIANRIVFEGRHPVFADAEGLHLFLTRRTCLGKTLEALRKDGLVFSDSNLPESSAIDKLKLENRNCSMLITDAGARFLNRNAINRKPSVLDDPRQPPLGGKDSWPPPWPW